MKSRGSLKLELFFAYLAAAAKVGAWVVVSALVFRKLGVENLGILALARSTVGLLAYAGAGLAPALVHQIAQAMRRPAEALAVTPMATRVQVLSYESPKATRPVLASHGPYSNGMVIAGILVPMAAALGFVYSQFFAEIHGIARGFEIREAVFFLAMGTILRLVSDVPGAILQTTHWLWLDYAILAVGECVWAGMAVCLNLGLSSNVRVWDLSHICSAFAISSAVVLFLRLMFGGFRQDRIFPNLSLVRWKEVVSLLGFGIVVVVSQLADFLYAPTDYILINHFLGAAEVAVYAPAVQFDSALALVVTVLAGVLLPRTALAHAAGDTRAVRGLYLRGTLASIALLVPIALLLWLAAPMIFRLWLGDEMRDTRAILPLVLFHTILGGSSIVGRSVLLGIGRVKAYAMSVLIAGVANVLLSWLFVSQFKMGLHGIVLGTIIVIAGRCAIWMPWYVLRTIRAAPAGPLETSPQTAAQEYAP